MPIVRAYPHCYTAHYTSENRKVFADRMRVLRGTENISEIMYLMYRAEKALVMPGPLSKLP